MKPKRIFKIYRTQEEIEEYFRKFRNRIALQEKLYSIAQNQKYFPATKDRIIPISSEYIFCLS